MQYRFHVVKMVHEKLNKARIDRSADAYGSQKRTAEELDVKARAKLFGSLTSSNSDLDNFY
ncbi:hypothetical protein ACE1CI_18355 [Aerosakkonemataceae cyanobacterium BLCC-F50]|uniref:Transposase n=1 Tax=Floridaenema flaviceps BLCC-F50 TaxID=3153642 RepID=A0ABV4XVC3_9CYAN